MCAATVVKEKHKSCKVMGKHTLIITFVSFVKSSFVHKKSWKSKMWQVHETEKHFTYI